MQLDDVDSDGDFFVRVYINGVDLFGESFSGDNTPSWTNANDGSDWDNDNHKTPEEIGDRFTYTLDVPDDIEDVSVWIDLFDDDSGWLGGTDDWCDISGDSTVSTNDYNPDTDDDGRRAELTYNLKYGTWTGADYPGDPNGYGHVSGEDDGDPRDQDDCELWFDITQNDFDGDGLTYWQEASPENPDAYGTDPTVFTNDDVDGDGLDGNEEIIHGTRPFMGDSDGDVINDWEEVNIYQTPPVKPNQRYAVLISAQWGDDYTHGGSFYDEFWNDLKIMYDILIEKGYTDDNIVICYADGNDIKDSENSLYGTSSGTDITDYPCTKIGIQNAFSTLNEIITENDFLFVWTFDHGAPATDHSHSYLYVDDVYIDDLSDTTIRDDDFATNYVGLINNCYRKTIIMLQCWSGGFIDDLSNSETVILTAGGMEVTHSADTEYEIINEIEYDHSEFFYHFNSAIRGETLHGASVNADTDGNGFISMLEALTYVQNNESRPETPELGDNGNLAGSTYL